MSVNADRRAEETALAAAFKTKLAGLDTYVPPAPALPSIERESRIRWSPSRRGTAGSAHRLGMATAAIAVVFAVALAGSWGFGRPAAAPGESASEVSEVSIDPSAAPRNTLEASIEQSAAPTNTPAPSPSEAASISAPSVSPIPTDGAATATAPWHAYEVYYLNLMNCTRTGGWVTSSGECSSDTNHTLPAQAPLVLDDGISDRVARPYARYLADNGILDHYAIHDPQWRMCSWGGFCGGAWGENLASPHEDMVTVEIYYQNEAFCRCEHYYNIMNPVYHRVGIGVWNSSGTWRIVVEFYP